MYVDMLVGFEEGTRRALVVRLPVIRRDGRCVVVAQEGFARVLRLAL
jgi:hypothetical protein